MVAGPPAPSRAGSHPERGPLPQGRRRCGRRRGGPAPCVGRASGVPDVLARVVQHGAGRVGRRQAAFHAAPVAEGVAMQRVDPAEVRRGHLALGVPASALHAQEARRGACVDVDRHVRDPPEAHLQAGQEAHLSRGHVAEVGAVPGEEGGGGGAALHEDPTVAAAVRGPGGVLVVHVCQDGRLQGECPAPRLAVEEAKEVSPVAQALAVDCPAHLGELVEEGGLAGGDVPFHDHDERRLGGGAEAAGLAVPRVALAAQAQRAVVEGVRGPLVATGVRALLRPLGGDVAPARRRGLRRRRGPGGLVGGRG